MNDFIKMLDEWFGKKAPQLPAGFKEWLVKVAPYLTIIGAVLMIPAILSIIGLGSFGWSMMGRYGYGGYGGGMMFGGIWPLFSIVLLVLYIIAIPGLFARSPKGWNMLFWAVLVCGLQNLVIGNILGLIVVLAVGFYFLFQIKPFYFGGVSMTAPPTPPTNS